MPISRSPEAGARSLAAHLCTIALAGALSAGCAFMGWAPPAASSEGSGGAATTAEGLQANESTQAKAGKGAAPERAPAPSPDRDGDGLPDATDRCPDTPEDRDGFQDDDGCPDPDNDGDGVLDARDHCPNQAAKTPDGCPAASAR